MAEKQQINPHNLRNEFRIGVVNYSMFGHASPAVPETHKKFFSKFEQKNYENARQEFCKNFSALITWYSCHQKYF
ncbi:MAG: hypothetical protein ACLFR0_02865 [Alphaproteobacteria bacterium]